MNKPSSSNGRVGGLIAQFGFAIALASVFVYGLGLLSFRDYEIIEFRVGTLSLIGVILLSVTALALNQYLNRAINTYGLLCLIVIFSSLPMWELVFRYLTSLSVNLQLIIVIFLILSIGVGLFSGYSSTTRGIHHDFPYRISRNTRHGHLNWEIETPQPRSLFEVGNSKPSLVENILRIIFPLGPGLGGVLASSSLSDGLSILAFASSILMGCIFLSISARCVAALVAFRLLEARESKQIWIAVPDYMLE